MDPSRGHRQSTHHGTVIGVTRKRAAGSSPEAVAGIGHHVALSIVRIERLAEGGGYFGAKGAQEKLIAGSSIPYSILHATQFFEAVTNIAFVTSYGLATVVDDTIRVAPVTMQPIAAADVVTALTEMVVGVPLGGGAEAADPRSASSSSSRRRCAPP